MAKANPKELTAMKTKYQASRIVVEFTSFVALAKEIKALADLSQAMMDAHDALK